MANGRTNSRISFKFYLLKKLVVDANFSRLFFLKKMNHFINSKNAFSKLDWNNFVVSSLIDELPDVRNPSI